MALPDVAHAAALDEAVIKPAFFAWLDFADEPVRANSSGRDRTPVGTGEPDLDGHLFTGVNSAFVSVSPVRFDIGGSQSVVVEISGLPGLDDEMLAQIEQRDNWQSRDARLWRTVRNRFNVQQGGFFNHYTGRMVDLRHKGSPTRGQIIQVRIESYLSAHSPASNATYLSQELYDPGDLSARAAVAIVNGNYTGAPGGSSLGPGAGRGGTFDDVFSRRVNASN